MIESLGRINELARKQRSEGLTDQEKVEQQALRKQYLREIRGQILNTIKNVTVIDPLGNDVTPEKVRRGRENNQSE